MGSNGEAALAKERHECIAAVGRIRSSERELDDLYPIKCPDPKFPRAVANNMRAQNGGIIALLNSRAAEIEVGEERSRMDAQAKSALKVSFLAIAMKNLAKLVAFILAAAATGKFFFGN